MPTKFSYFRVYVASPCSIPRVLELWEGSVLGSENKDKRKSLYNWHSFKSLFKRINLLAKFQIKR